MIVFESGIWILVLVAAIFIIMLVCMTIEGQKQRKNKAASDEEILSESVPESVPEPFGEYARIVSKRIEDGYTGNVKTPSYNLYFIVTFRTDSGETKEFKVSEETFNRLSEHQTGMLITIDGNFFDFGDGEEV